MCPDDDRRPWPVDGSWQGQPQSLPEIFAQLQEWAAAGWSSFDREREAQDEPLDFSF